MSQVVIDYRDWARSEGRRRKDTADADVPGACDTGSWLLIHRGETEVAFPVAAFGCKLALVGTELPIHPVYSGAPPSYSVEGSTRENRTKKLRGMRPFATLGCPNSFAVLVSPKP